MPLTSHQIRALLWAAIAVVIWLLFTLLAPVLMPFLLAAVLAYALHPLVERLHARRIPRWLGAGLAITMLSLVMLAVVLLIVPVITKQVPLLKDQVPALLDSVNTRLVPLLARFGVDLQVDVSLVRGWMQELITGHESELIQGLLSSLRIGGSALAAVFGNLILAPIVAYYLLLDWSGLVERSKRLIPPRWLPSVQSFLDETDEVLGQYLRGQLLVMGVLAVFYTVALALVGLKLALPIGVFTGLAVFVPYLGFGLGLVMGLLAAVLQFQSLTGASDAAMADLTAFLARLTEANAVMNLVGPDSIPDFWNRHAWDSAQLLTSYRELARKPGAVKYNADGGRVHVTSRLRPGDMVEIAEGRPISKTKSWVVTRLIEKAKLV